MIKSLHSLFSDSKAILNIVKNPARLPEEKIVEIIKEKFKKAKTDEQKVFKKSLQAKILYRDDSGNSALSYAYGQKFYKVMHLLIKKLNCFDPSFDKNDFALVHYAAISNNKKYISEYLSQGHDPNLPVSSTGDNLLHLAINHHCNEVVDHLLLLLDDSRCICIKKNNQEETPFTLAYKNKNKVALKSLLNHINPLSEELDTLGMAYIHYAAYAGKKKNVKIYLKFGGRVNLCTHDFHIPLSYAIKGKNKEIVEILLLKNSSLGLNKIYPLALEQSYKEKAGKVISRMIWKKMVEKSLNPYSTKEEYPLCFDKIKGDDHSPCFDKGSLVHHAAYLGMVNFLKEYFKQGKTPNILSSVKKATLLHWAILGKSERVAKLLVSNPTIHLQVVDLTGMNPLTLAAKNKMWNIVEILIEKITLDQAKCHYNQFSIAHGAAFLGKNALLQQCFDLGTNINANNVFGTPLYQAIKGGQKKTVEWLIQKSDCDVTVPIFRRFDKEESAMTLAIKKREFTIAALLLEKINIFNITFDVFGNAFIHYAAFIGMLKKVGEYCKGRGDINIKNSSGNTILHLAVLGSHKTIVEYILTFPECRSDLKNKAGETALDIAKDLNDRELIHLLTDSKESLEL